MRLDKYLTEKTPGISRSKIQKAIKEGLVSVNGQKVTEPDFQIKESDNVELPEFKSDELKPSDIPLKIIFENDDLAVIDKPAGLVVHPGAGNTEDTLSNALLTYFPQIRTVGEPHRPGIVHRLDEDTSGLIVVAKTQNAYEFLKKGFLDRKVEKEYLALIHGVPEKLHGMIDAPLEKIPLKQRMSVRDQSDSGGKIKSALTEYWVLDSSRPIENGTAGQTALIRVKLHTGRTHQIRAHLAHIGHPIVGDSVYGSAFSRQDHDIPRQFLHAFRLKFQLLDGTWLELESPLPSELIDILNQLGLKHDHKF